MRWYGYALSFTISTHLVLDEAWIRIVTCLCSYLLYLRNTRVIYHAYVGLQVLGSVYIPEVNYIMMVLTVVVIAIFKTTVQLGNAYGKPMQGLICFHSTL